MYTNDEIGCTNDSYKFSDQFLMRGGGEDCRARGPSSVMSRLREMGGCTNDARTIRTNEIHNWQRRNLFVAGRKLYVQLG